MKSLQFINNYTKSIPSIYSEKWPVKGSYYKISKAGKVCARGIICKVESGESRNRYLIAMRVTHFHFHILPFVCFGIIFLLFICRQIR